MEATEQSKQEIVSLLDAIIAQLASLVRYLALVAYHRTAIAFFVLQSSSALVSSHTAALSLKGVPDHYHLLLTSSALPVTLSPR